MKQEEKQKIAGHGLALFTILVWGTTFVATKALLVSFTALQIMLLRFSIAWLVLLLITGWDKSRKKERIEGCTGEEPCNHRNWKDEGGIFLLSMSGVTLYYLFENTALNYTLASNVSILVAAAPIMTAVLAHLFTKDEKMTRHTWAGFLVAMAGVVLVVFNGTYVLKLNPLGDFLSILAAFSWAVYSVLLKKYVNKYDNLILTRKISFYGLVTTAPLALGMDGTFSLQPLAAPDMLFCILFLGFLGSAVCYMTWNISVKFLGVVSTNNYIYLSPFITMVTAAVVLGEKITAAGLLGAALIIGGIVLSERGEQTDLRRKTC